MQGDYLRINSDRLIYDIPSAEFKNLVKEYDLEGEELYRAILKYFNLEVLTSFSSCCAGSYIIK